MKKLLMRACSFLLLICVAFSAYSCTSISDAGKESALGTQPLRSEAPSATQSEEESQFVEDSQTASEESSLLPSEPSVSEPTLSPTEAPSVGMTGEELSASQSAELTFEPTEAPTDAPTETPTDAPIEIPSASEPTEAPTDLPSMDESIEAPTDLPSASESSEVPIESAPTEIPTEAPTATETESDSGSQEKSTLSPELELLAEINRMQNLLSSDTSILISVDRYDENAFLGSCRYVYSSDEKGELTFAITEQDKDGTSIDFGNYFDGALYSRESDGTLVFAILPSSEATALFTFAVDLYSQTPKGEVVSADGMFLLETFYEQDDLFFECRYTFDSESKRILGGERTAFSGGSFCYREELTYSYGDKADAFEIDWTAYQAVTSSSSHDVFSFDVVEVDEKGEKTATRTYTFAENAEVLLISGSHVLYKNFMCTADITDLKVYLTENAWGCTVYLAEKRPEISLDYTLTDADFEQFKSLLTQLESLIASGGEDEKALISLYEQMIEKFYYLDAQSDAGYLLYCRNQRNSEAQQAYIHASQVRSDALVLYHNFLEKVYESDSLLKAIVFYGWTEEDFADFFGTEDHDEEIYALEHANEQLTLSFYNLIGNGAPPWDQAAVAELYVQLVANNQSLAKLHGYDDYYAYASEEIFCRLYTPEERAAFRSYVSTYIVPLLASTYSRFYELPSNLTLTQYLAYEDLLSSPYSGSSLHYLKEYLATYEGTLADNMNSFFEKGAVIFADHENAYSGAFVSYNSLYEEPYAYFGLDYQDILSIVHELGHYASLYTYSLEEMPYDLAETHSQGNEWMFLAYLEDQVDPTVAELVVTYRLYSGLLSIVYATMADEFEDIVYHAQTPYTADQLEAIVDALALKYGGAEFLNAMGIYTPYEYVQYVTFSSPVYYLNYATSEIVSIGLYVEAHESYENAQELYRALQEDAIMTDSFVSNIEAMGFMSPFEETLYQELCVLFSVSVGTP